MMGAMSATEPTDLEAVEAVDSSLGDLPRAFDNRVSRDLGVPIPIVQAPMGWIARAQLASAVSRCGACGIIETSSGELDNVKDEIRKMRDLTDRPFGVNIAQAFVRDPAIAEIVIEQYLTTVRPAHEQFIEPSKRFADVIVPQGGLNRPALDVLLARVEQLASG